MRNRFLTLAVILCLLAFPALSPSQDPGSATSTGKLGVVNIQQAIAGTAEGKKALAELEKKYEPKRQDLQQREQKINALQDQLQKQATTLSDDEQVRLRREIDEEQRVFKRLQEDAQADFQNDNQEVVRRIGQKMLRVINDYAPQHGFALIMDPAAAQVPVYFAANGIDITETIVKLYDATNPTAAAAPGTISSAPAPTRPAGSTGTRSSAPPLKSPVTPKPGDKPKP